jgi:DNA-binding protein HU-beta
MVLFIIILKDKHTMNKKELINAIAEKASMTIEQAEAALSATFNTIQQVMVAQGNVAITGFGNFTTKLRAKRAGRNPKTGEAITIPEALVPIFKAGTQLKELINSTKE